MNLILRPTIANLLMVIVTAVVLGGCGENTTSPPVAQEAAKLSPEQELAALTKKAEAGNADAQYNLGSMYAIGSGVPKDSAKAYEWLEKAASHGNVNAQEWLGDIYMRERKDSKTAAMWFQRAAENGSPTAQSVLGWMYLSGDGVARDAEAAHRWLLKAAEQGVAPAQFLLGDAYRYGKGVKKDIAKAVLWIRKAADQGHATAQLAMGAIYSDGEGVPKDAAKAVEWWQKAAAQGKAGAQYNLGVMYVKGEGVPKDTVLAYAWFNIAAISGDTYALKNRGIVESMLTATQLAEAQRLSSNWKKGQLPEREGKPGTASAGAHSAPGALTKKGAGTVFVVSKAGHAITNQHVAGGCAEIRIQGRDGVAKLVTEDAINDLALVQISGTTSDTATIAPEPNKLRQGEDIVAFGFPLNAILSSGGNLTPGVVSALTGLGNNTNQIQITAPIQPGSSGSPVLNRMGEVVGVVSMKLDDKKMASATGSIGQNVNFAVSGLTLKTFLDTHKVDYRSGGTFSFGSKSTADLADEARKWTLVAECWK